MCRTYVEEMIDFPVSDSWRNHYFDRGLTPHHSPRYRSCRDTLEEKVDGLEDVIRSFLEAMQDGGRPRDAYVQSPSVPRLERTRNTSDREKLTAY